MRRLLFWDLDHMLFDTDASQAAAIDAVLGARTDADPSVDLGVRFAEINEALWRRVEREGLSPNVVKTARFEQLVDETGIDADAADLAVEYADALGRCGDAYTGAEDALAAGRETAAAMGLITNGIGDIQRARIGRTGLDRWFDGITISGEVGTTKPNREIFDIARDAVGAHAHGSDLDEVMLGDSLVSDIRGGLGTGMRVVWFDRFDRGWPTDAEWTTRLAEHDGRAHRITSLIELPDLLRDLPR